jgi:hypothetical protein
MLPGTSVHRLWHRRLQLLQQRRVPVGDFGREALPTERYSALVALDLEGPSQEKAAIHWHDRKSMRKSMPLVLLRALSLARQPPGQGTSMIRRPRPAPLSGY